MVATGAYTALVFGLDATIVQAQATVGADESRGDLLDRLAAAETLDRVRAAVRNSDLAWPAAAVTLSPPARPSADPGGDVAVACAVLAAAGLVPAARLEQTRAGRRPRPQRGDPAGAWGAAGRPAGRAAPRDRAARPAG
jgi:magnesium chelatase family protein